MDIYVITVTGVGISTYVCLQNSMDHALITVESLKKEYRLSDVVLMSPNCWSGYGEFANCQVEITIHQKKLSKWDFPLTSDDNVL